MSTVHESQFGIRKDAQLQILDGRTFEFQPEHLLCDECWVHADPAFAHASFFGEANYGDTAGHSMTVTKKPFTNGHTEGNK
jgi:hypothetical protein